MPYQYLPTNLPTAISSLPVNRPTERPHAAPILASRAMPPKSLDGYSLHIDGEKVIFCFVIGRLVEQICCVERHIQHGKYAVEHESWLASYLRTDGDRR